ncbi:sulfotransferase family protein [Denitrobaculum tricleocarpae]|uniref:Sulfotransferase n=1 Tax=Denitrobaculum tricleocarpae TaxID=2591009 RepID=A0A545TN74_9PROT|nr:sulfotransferase [Denitrobaculum tricleocarpae]TQV78646.1 sulfotransferase [Denitrobaculum tricleocarpae]
MYKRLNFISGLPRSGSTLLAAILRQNPRISAEMSSPLAPLFNACLTGMGADNEFSVFFKEEQKRSILEGVFENYYKHLDTADVVFDTNRMWASQLTVIKQLFPETKVICCVRNPAWILDSVERLLRKNALDVSRLFGNSAERATVFSRAETLLNPGRMIGFPWSALKDAYYSAESDSLLLVDYELLASRPREVLALIYDFIGEPAFEHDFEDVTYEQEQFDQQLLTKNLHTVRGKVELTPRQSILPPDLFKRCQNLAFWHDPNGTAAHRIVVAKEDPPAESNSGAEAKSREPMPDSVV